MATDALSRGRIMVASSVLQEVEEIATELPESYWSYWGRRSPAGARESGESCGLLLPERTSREYHQSAMKGCRRGTGRCV